MKACNGLWIVAPITRAVDDKAAKSLLGDSFKRQLKFDGIYSAVTFICSKTDDISITEAAESLDLEEETEKLWGRADGIESEIRTLKKHVTKMRDEKAANEEILEQCEYMWEQWEYRQWSLSKGKTVYRPEENAKKRKRTSEYPCAGRHQLSSHAENFDRPKSPDDNSSGGRENSDGSGTRIPLTESDIEEAITSVKSQRNAHHETRMAIAAEIEATFDEIAVLDFEKAAIAAELKALCVRGRSEYSRGAIKHDFAMGIKE
jgi:hypothetical protein